MNMWGPGLNASNNDIFILLQTCNPGLTTYNGSVSRRKASDKGVSLKVGITEDMKDLIRSKKNRQFFGITHAVCYFDKPKKANEQKQVEEENMMNFTESETERETDGTTGDGDSALDRTVINKNM